MMNFASSELILSVIVLLSFIALLYTYQNQSTSPTIDLVLPVVTLNFALFAILMGLAIVYIPKYAPYTVTITSP